MTPRPLPPCPDHCRLGDTVVVSGDENPPCTQGLTLAAANTLPVQCLGTGRFLTLWTQKAQASTMYICEVYVYLQGERSAAQCGAAWRSMAQHSAAPRWEHGLLAGCYGVVPSRSRSSSWSSRSFGSARVAAAHYLQSC